MNRSKEKFLKMIATKDNAPWPRDIERAVLFKFVSEQLEMIMTVL
jgi:hypothetical protein